MLSVSFHSFCSIDCHCLQFKRINFAHAVLTDPRKRAIYDREGLQGLQDGLAGGLFGESSGTSEQQICEYWMHDV